MQELFPLLGFIVAFLGAKWTGNGEQAIYWATAALMLISSIQLITQYLKQKRVEKKQLWTTVLIVVLGGATLIFHNPLIIKWKPTITYLIFAAILWIFPYFNKEILPEKMLHSVFVMPTAMWQRMNFAWIIFLIFMAVANLFVAYRFSDDAWFAFKIWGGVGGMMIFMLAQVWLLRGYLREEKDGEHGE